MFSSQLRVLSFLRSANYVFGDEVTNYYLGLIRRSEAVIVKTMSTGAFYSNPELGQLLYDRFAHKINRETEKFLNLSHESIVAVQKELLLQNSAIIALSFHPYGKLLDWVSERAYLTIHSVCLVVQQICKGLSYMHRLGLAHGNLTMSSILFKTAQAQSACIAVDSSVKSEMLKLCRPIPIDLQYCPPELKDDMVHLQRSWSLVTDETRNQEQLIEVDRLLSATPERDVWCVGIIMHILLAGCEPFDIEMLENSLSDFHYPDRKCSHTIFGTISTPVVEQLEQFLHSDPKYRATAEDGALCLWFSDEQTVYDSRNILYRNEEAFLRFLLPGNSTRLFTSGPMTKIFRGSVGNCV